MSRQRVAHALTGYHWRRRPGGSKLAICGCGWRCWMFRRLDWICRWRYVTRLCWLRGHAWGAPEEMHFGPVGFDESEDTYVGSSRQCDRCYQTERVGK